MLPRPLHKMKLNDNLPPPPHEPLFRVYQVPPESIQLLTAWTEAYDGIALIRSIDEKRGIIECWIMPDYESVFDSLLESFKAQYPIQSIGRGLD
jgi:hypothetical protein